MRAAQETDLFQHTRHLSCESWGISSVGRAHARHAFPNSPETVPVHVLTSTSVENWFARQIRATLFTLLWGRSFLSWVLERRLGSHIQETKGRVSKNRTFFRAKSASVTGVDVCKGTLSKYRQNYSTSQFVCQDLVFYFKCSYVKCPLTF